MKKIKVMTVVGTRPEIIKLCRVIHELDLHTNHILVHSGQNYDYELNEIFFSQLGIRTPDFFLNAVGKNTAHTIGNIISSADDLLERECPDAFLILGDTNSCLSVIAAKRRKIPIFHIEAGNRCFDQRVPEEINRKIIDHISDINLTYTEHARRYLINEGLKPDTIFKVGSPMKEVLLNYKIQIDESIVLEKLNLEPEKFFLVSAHREENIESEINFLDLVETLKAILSLIHI
jgi:UDP-N-acetylglucosamine 2-epimerase (non-hydrolysing)